LKPNPFSFLAENALNEGADYEHRITQAANKKPPVIALLRTGGFFIGLTAIDAKIEDTDRYLTEGGERNG